MSTKSDWYQSHILDEIQRASREWLKNKIKEVNSSKRCETVIK